MRFTVVWLPRAERELAKLWEASDNRAALTRAADRIERLLATQPDHVGEERPDGRRLLFEEPLGLQYRVLQADRLVRVVTIWDITRR